MYLYTAAGSYAGTGACTGASGSFTIPSIAPGSYTVAVFDPVGTHPTTWYGNVTTKASAQTFSVAGGATTSPIDVTVSELTGITGHITDASTAGRVAGACIYATQTSGGSASYATCIGNSDTYAITGMAPGAYNVAIVDPAGLHTTVHATATVVANKTTVAVDANMAEVTSIVGSLLDASTGVPVANACVMLYTPGGGYVAGSYRCTDAQGRFAIDGIAPGKYLVAYYDPAARFVTFWWDGKADRSSAVAVTVDAATTTSLGAARVSTFGSATGVVRNADNTPAADVCVYADDLTGHYTGAGACSDANGRYTLSGLTAGQYKIAFYPPGSGSSSPYWYLQRATELSAIPITINGLATTNLQDEKLVIADDTNPPAPVTSLNVTSANTSVHLSWTNPNDSDFAGVTIRRAQGSVAPTSPTDGTAVAEVTTPGTTVDDPNVTAGQTYSYAVFAHDQTPNYATAATATITALAASAAQHECGTLGANTTWSPASAPVYVLDCGVTVAPNTTLTIQPGTVVKGTSGTGIVVQGSLIVSGTTADSATFTSLTDDSAAGDTNKDGSSTGPSRGDWVGISTSTVSGFAAPSVLINHARVSYANIGLSASQSAVSLRNSAIDHISGDGVDITSPAGIPTVTTNTVTTAAGSAIAIQGASLDMGALNGNSGGGNGLNGVQLSQDTVTVSSTLPWTGTLVPVLYGGCSALTVPPGITLTLNAGTVIKAQANNCAYVNVQGSLVANGTLASPVTLTSWRDDTVGGDTNGDGSATGPQTGDWGGVSSSPAGNGNPSPTVNLDHVKLGYASTGVSASQSTTSIRNSVIAQIISNGIDVGSPVGVPTVSNNTVTNVGGTAITVSNASLDMGLLNGNSGSGNGLNGVQLSQDTVTVSSALPWTGTLVPVISGGCASLTISPSVTLTLGAGTIVKGQTNNCSYFSVQGSLMANGTAASPVTMTSWRDDSVGGDTNGDGNATSPQKGDWGGVSSSPAGSGNPNPTINLDHVKIAYAATALSASGSTTAITHSTIDRTTSDGIDVTFPVGAPTVSNNTVTNAAGTAISVYNASLDMGLLNGNSGSGNGLNGVQLYQDTVTVSSSLPWTGTLVPVVSGGCASLTVPPNVTLTLGPGTIVKGQTNNCAYFNIQGSLVANGTVASPVTLTSWRDDSVGGDTNGDGNATSPQKGDWGGVSAGPAGNGNPDPTVNLDHVKIAYTYTALSTSGSRTTLTNSTIDRATSDGIDVTSPVGVPTVTNNTVTNAGGSAITIQSASVNMGLLNGNSGSSNGLNGVQLSQDTVSVSSALPWTGNLVPVLYGGCNALTVPAQVTLTLGPGTIIKGQSNSCAYFSVQGTLVANGTAASPVTLTSWRDDSIGGDTNGDGNATGPQKGDWGGVSSSPAGNGNTDPTINLDHVRIYYASIGLSAYQSTTSVTNSTITKTTSDGIDVSSPVGVPTVLSNTVTNAGGTAINIQSAPVDMGLLNGNSGSGNGLNGVQLSQDTVTVSSALPWTGTLVPVLYGGCNALTVPPNVTLTLGAGTVIKAQSNSCAYLNVQGTLAGTGTVASPVTLTSWRDDSVGGDTNGDGNATGPQKGDWGGISAGPAGNGNPNPTVNLDHAKITYAGVGLSTSQTTTSLTNSTVSQISIDGVDVSSPDGIPTLSNNTVTNAGGTAIYVYYASLDMGQLDGNSGSNNGLNGVVLYQDTVAVSSALPWTGNLIPVIYGGCSGLLVPPGVTLTLGAGTLVKSTNCATITVQGHLVGNGTSNNPVVLTSLKDDSFGGDTNADGSATSPAQGDWNGVVLAPPGNGNPDPTASLTYTQIYYATTGLATQYAAAAVQGSHVTFARNQTAVSVQAGTVSFSGSTITESQTGISVQSGQSSSFQGTINSTDLGAAAPAGTTLDVRNTDWGNANGPAPWGDGTLVQGTGIIVYPWVGAPPPPPPPSPDPPALPPPNGGCPDVFYITADGSGQPATGDFSNAPEMRNLLYALRYKLGTERTVLPIELVYPADGVEELATGWDGWLRYYASYSDGVFGGNDLSHPGVEYTGLVNTVRAEHQNCPDSQFLLVGYSQGAWVVHDSVNELSRIDPEAVARDLIAGIVLVADPEREPDNAAEYGTAAYGSTGILHHIAGMSSFLGGPTPTELTGVTHSLCNQRDLVCAPSTLDVTTANGAILTLSGFIEAFPFTAASALWGRGQLIEGDFVHTSKLPDPPSAYRCDASQAVWEQAHDLGNDPPCGSLLTDQGISIGGRVLLFAKPTQTEYIFSESLNQPFSEHLTASVRDDRAATWRLKAGSDLPPGVSLASDGAITGSGTTPANTYHFYVEVTGAFDVWRSAKVSITVA